MIAKPVLMIHEVRESIFELPLSNYTLTFDDGLYSQYHYFDRFREIPTEKIYFISSGIVCTGVQSLEFPTCKTAHAKAFAGNFEDYMTIPQIKELMQDPLVTIGAHSHSHLDLYSLPKLFDRVTHIGEDSVLMLQWFQENLGIQPTKFCFPYNEDLNGMYKAVLHKHGFTEYYGQERLAVETIRGQILI